MGTMSNIVKRPSLSEEAVARLIDPRTGERLRPLGVVGGRLVWPVMGAAEDDDSGGDGSGTEDKNKDPEGTGSSEDGKGGDGRDPNPKIAALEEEKQRHVRRRQEAEDALAEAKKELDELRNKDKDDSTKNAERLMTLEKDNAQLQEDLKQARLENAFLKDNTFTWHNPGRALALADLSEVEIDSDGTVHGLKKALEALSKSDAYLLKTEDKKASDDAPNTEGKVKNSSKKDEGKTDPDREALIKKYPALRR